VAGIKPESAKMELRKVPASKLTTDMVLQQEIRTLGRGMLLAAKGQEITQTLLIKLDHLSRWGTIDNEIMALVPLAPTSSPLVLAASASSLPSSRAAKRGE
jgi:hypothetical protein